MSCNSNNTTPNTLSIQYFTSPTCFDCGNDCGGQVYNSKCIIYTGPNLGCSGVNTNDSLETAIQKIDEQICSIIGDYSSYNMNCLPTYWGEAITTQADFVDAITSYACDIQTQLTEFIDETFDSYETTTGARLTSLEVPGITCSFAGAVNTDTLVQVLNKYCTAFTTLNNKFNISSVTWNECFTVVSAPTTLPAAFQLLADQICDTKSLITNYGLPFFNNTTACLGGTSSDSLVETIGLMIDRLCSTPTFNINELDWGCVSQPTVVQTDLQNAFQTVLTTLSSLTEQSVTWSEDFVVTANNEEDPCAGVNVALATPLNIDRFVAATALDEEPGTLQDKLVAGTNVSLDFSSETEVEINVNLGNVYKVKSNSAEADGDAGYLDAKVNGGTNSGVTITPTYNGSTKKVDFTPSVDPSILWDTIFNYINSSVIAQEKFCTLSSKCPNVSYATLDWSFENVNLVTEGSNFITITDITIPGSPIVLLNNVLNTVAANTGIIPMTSTLAGRVFKLEVTGASPNTLMDLVLLDNTTGIAMSTQLNQSVSLVTISYIFTLISGHSYTFGATTH